MGADLILAIIPWPADEQGQPWSRNDDLVTMLQGRLASYTDEQLMECPRGGNDDDTPGEVRQWLNDQIDHLFGDYLLPRDCADVTLAGKTWLITGGPSWGDDPTESYAFVSALEYLGLTDVPISFRPDSA